MSNFEDLRIIDFDHLEFAVKDLEQSSELYLRLGFERAGTREILERKLRSILLVQNQIQILLSHSEDPKDPISRFNTTHGDGVFSLAFRCEDAVSALETAVNRGAEMAESPRAYKKDFGKVEQAAIRAFGDVRHTFVSRSGNLFGEGFDFAHKPQNDCFGLKRIDHVTCNVEAGEREKWTQYYERIFGLKNTRFFDIHTEQTGLYSSVMQSPNGIIKMPFNEPIGDNSQIQEFIDINHGPGIQHVALETNDIIESVGKIRKAGIAFLEVPSTYYEELPKRVPTVTEKTSNLQELGILADGDSSGYLLQIFTQNVVGPFFYECIQRKGHAGFGEGNFRALFEAMERDQIRRGVLKQS